MFPDAPIRRLSADDVAALFTYVAEGPPGGGASSCPPPLCESLRPPFAQPETAKALLAAVGELRSAARRVFRAGGDDCSFVAEDAFVRSFGCKALSGDAADALAGRKPRGGLDEGGLGDLLDGSAALVGAVAAAAAGALGATTTAAKLRAAAAALAGAAPDLRAGLYYDRR